MADQLIEKYLDEKKKELPPHIKALMKKADKKDKEKQKKFGMKVIDRTPKGYGPTENKYLGEKWGKDVEIKKTGEYEGMSVAELKKKIKALEGKPGNKEKMGELLFALRAKQGWKKGQGATGL